MISRTRASRGTLGPYDCTTTDRRIRMRRAPPGCAVEQHFDDAVLLVELRIISLLFSDVWPGEYPGREAQACFAGSGRGVLA